MNITLENNHTLTPKQLALALVNATPDEFAALWLSFEKVVTDEKLDSFAEAMSAPLGSARKRPLEKLVKLMDYHKENRNRG